jgi:hypothetical protein
VRADHSFIDIFENALEPEICREIIRRFEADVNNQFTGVVGNEHGDRAVNGDSKNCTELSITGNRGWEDIDKELFKAITPILAHLVDKYPGFGCGSGYEDEGYRIKRYSANGVDSFKPHVDVSSMHSAHRQQVFMWYLNDVEEGGETYFPYHDISVKPKEGRLATFPPFWTHYHEGRVPISNAKYAVLGWFTFKQVQLKPQNRVPVNVT